MAQVEDRGAKRFRTILVLLTLIAIVGLALILWLTQGQAIMTALQPKPAVATVTRTLTTFVEITPTATPTTAPTATSVIRRETVIIIAATPIPTATARATATLTSTIVVTPTVVVTPTATVVVAKPPAPRGSIAYHKIENGADTLAIINLDNNTITPLAPIGAVSDLQFNTFSPIGVFSPDNTKFAYISTFKAEGPFQLRVLDFATNTNRVIFSSQVNGALFSPAWSPDGKRIAFVEVNDLRTWWLINIVNADGSLCGDKLVCTLRKAHQGDQFHGGLAWSIFGLFALGSNSSGGNDVYSLFADGFTLNNLTNHPADDSVPAWSPDGKQIAFQSTRDGHFQIYVMDSLGGNLRRVSRGDSTDFSPTWSPDGKWLAFASVRDGAPNIYVMDLEGGNVTRLTFDGGDRPSWSR